MRKCPRAAGYSSPYHALPQSRQVDDSAGEKSRFLKYSFPAGPALPLPPQKQNPVYSIIQHPPTTTSKHTHAHTHSSPSPLALPLAPLWMIHLLPETHPIPTNPNFSFIYLDASPATEQTIYFPKLESSRLFWWK